jgi:hypothetical protein
MDIGNQQECISSIYLTLFLNNSSLQKLPTEDKLAHGYVENKITYL